MSTIQNAILVYECTETGQVKHKFCTETDARRYLELAAVEMRGGSMFAADGVEAEFVLQVSPDLREKVEDAKRRMKWQIRVRDALDRHGVTRDREQRVAIFKALEDVLAGG